MSHRQKQEKLMIGLLGELRKTSRGLAISWETIRLAPLQLASEVSYGCWLADLARLSVFQHTSFNVVTQIIKKINISNTFQIS